MATVSEIQEKVVSILITDYDFGNEEAEETVTNSLVEDEGMWNVNAEAENIAKYLADSDDND